MPYKSKAEILAKFNEMSRTPEKCVRYEIGRTVKGEPIYMYRLGFPETPGRRKLSVLYCGSTHGNEHPGAELLLLYAEWLFYMREPIARDIMTNVFSYIIPIHNLDSYDEYKRVNANCVDINRNFPEGWGGPGSSPGRCCSICRGDSPADQPETKALISVFEKFKPDFYLSIHSGTEALAYPPSCYTSPPPDKEKYEEICKRIVELSRERGVEPYRYGQVPFYRIDMAEPVRIPYPPYVIYQCCGTCIDTAYLRYRILSMVLEATSPHNPPYDRIPTYYFPRFLPIAIVLSTKPPPIITPLEKGKLYVELKI